MKKKVYKLLSCIVVALLFCVGLCRLAALVERKSSHLRFADFYKHKENIDVLFLGTSHVWNAVFPMELWKDYGIVSYNLSENANNPAICYWQLVNACDHTQPKVVVFDCLHVDSKTKLNHLGWMHECLDPIPMSMNKVRAAFDLFDNITETAQFLLPFSQFHERWKDIGMADFVHPRVYEKGAMSNIGVAVPRRFSDVPLSDKNEENGLGIEYLIKMIEFCKKKQIPLLLTYIPFPAAPSFLRESHRVSDIAANYQVEYLNWEQLRNLVDFDIDCKDPNSHLNPSGARKITKFLGQFLRNSYDIPDHRNDPKYASWHKDYQEYTQFKISTIKNQKSLKNALMLLSDRNFSYAVYFANDRHFQNKIIMKLLRNTGADVERMFFQSPSLIVVDNKKKAVSYLKMNESADSSFGTLSVKKVKDDYSFTLNGKEVLKIKTGERLESAILAFDNETGRLIVAGKYQSL